MREWKQRLKIMNFIGSLDESTFVNSTNFSDDQIVVAENKGSCRVPFMNCSG